MSNHGLVLSVARMLACVLLLYIGLNSSTDCQVDVLGLLSLLTKSLQ